MKAKTLDDQKSKSLKILEEAALLKEKLSCRAKENKNLQESLKNKNAILDTLPLGTLVTRQGKVIDINKAALEMLGYGAEEMFGRDLLDFVHPSSKAFVRKIHQNRLAGKYAPELYEADFVKKNGEKISCDIRERKFHLNRRVAFLICFSRSEERKMRERNLIQSKKTEAISTMSSGLASTLRPAADLINTNAEQIRRSAAPEWKSFSQELSGIEEGSRQIMDTLHHLEGLCKTTHNHSELNTVDLKKAIKDAIVLVNQSLREKARERETRVNFKTYLRSVSPVRGIKEEIKGLIARVIMNAVEAMPTGGDLYISTEETGGYAHIYVQDNGDGIPGQIKDRILDPFFTTKEGTNCGLGLSLCSAIAKRHNGSLEIASKEKHGTMVTIKLPLESVTKQKKPSARFLRRKLKNARILIVENDDMIREILSQHLSSKGYRVDRTVTGSEALNRVKRKSFDMVIIGSEVPGIAWYSLAAKIKKVDKGLPIAAVIGPAGIDKARGVKKSAVDLIIGKPIDMDLVEKQLSDLLIFSMAS
ncbi:MAG: hypothetical protein DRH11_02660 [Deltaproteobacteria bacterium]|nr:MAG: hypothetical protein DRG63_13410 [Deltaproteobacteria bacterium]RLB35474.1 MAG: hypothetical protein DRH11_02660 [Deltaproteobacteria bacterium]